MQQISTRIVQQVVASMGQVKNPFKSNRWKGRNSPFILVGVALLVIATFSRVRRLSVGNNEISTLSSKSGSPGPAFLSGNVFVHREVIDGRDVLWASPKENGGNEIKGLVFLAHDVLTQISIGLPRNHPSAKHV